MGDPSGRRILVVEDEALIGLLLQSVLGELGWVVVGVARNITEALAFIEIERPGFDAATLDLNLGGEISIKVAAALEARGIPFIITTGYDDPMHLADFAVRPIVAKPIVEEALAQALESLGLGAPGPGMDRSDGGSG